MHECVCSSLCSHVQGLCVYKHVYTNAVSGCAHVPVCVYGCGHDIVYMYVGVCCFTCIIEFA